MQRVLNNLLLAGFLGGLLFSAGCQRTCALAGGAAAQCLAGDRPGASANGGPKPGNREVAIVSAGGGINP